MRTLIAIVVCFCFCLNNGLAQNNPAQDSTSKNGAFQGHLLIKVYQRPPVSCMTIHMPLLRYKQGVICNFEDQLNRKKVPFNFQLGNSKY